MKFKLTSSYQPTGDQPAAIDRLTGLFQQKADSAVLLGVTGSGKTFSVAHLIQNLQLPTLIISHNKTLAGQLYQEFRDFFPDNAVSYFVSYYDYYQPEAYVPHTDTYIAKEADINQEIDKLRLEATSHLFSRRDVIVVASVSCIYNIGSPEQYRKRILQINQSESRSREDFLAALVALYYQRTRLDFTRGTFRLRGETVEIYPPYADEIFKISWEGTKVVEITSRPVYGDKPTPLERLFLYPAKHYLTDPEKLEESFRQIRRDLKIRAAEFQKEGKILEANRIIQRVTYDLEMLKEVGYINGIENYSRYFDGRLPGDPPYTLLDYFVHQYGRDFLVVIDESHMTVPQIRGMYRGDLSRKQTLIDFGFRLPSALDNRPLKFEEVLPKFPQTLFVSATPDDWEIKHADNRVVEQLIRPTGLIDPLVEIRPTAGQVQDLMKEIKKRQKIGERVLVSTLTKRMAEELSRYLEENGGEITSSHTGGSRLAPRSLAAPLRSFTRRAGEAGMDSPGVGIPGKSPSLPAPPRESSSGHSRGENAHSISVHYLHADIHTMERSDILADLRLGKYDVIVGVNLLREGLDLPEVSLVVIFDADKQGFLRSKTALVQTMGRAARHAAGRVILYADEESSAMKAALKEVARRRQIQTRYNQEHGITPVSIQKPIRERILPVKEEEKEPDEEALTPGEARKLVKRLHRQMRAMARELEFEKAAKTRDRIDKIKVRFNLID